MPHYFPNTIRAQLKKRTVRAAHLLELQFDNLSGFDPAYLWNGSRTITTGGHDWIGLRHWGSIEGIDETQTGIASTIKATVKGVVTNNAIDHDFLTLAISENRSHYVGQLLRVWLQFFDEDWAPLDDPFARAAGIMDVMEISRQQNDDGATIRTISISAPNIFYGRKQPPFGNFTDRDQQARHPGDLGLQYIADLQNYSLPVPWGGSTDTPIGLYGGFFGALNKQMGG